MTCPHIFGPSLLGNNSHKRMQNTQKISLILMVMLALLLPITTSGTVIVSMLAMMFAFLAFSFQEIQLPFRQPMVALCVTFFIFQVLAAFYSTAPLYDIVFALKRSGKLLYLPFFTLLFISPKTRKTALFAFLVAMIVVMVAGMVKFLFHFNWGGPNYSQAAVFKDHIQTNSLMALGAFIAACMAPHYPKYKNGLYLLALLMGTFIFFLGIGRSGYVLFILLALLWGFRKAGLKGTLIALTVMMVILIGAYFGVQSFHARVDAVGQEIAKYQQGNAFTSSGQRIGFNLNSWKIIKERPFLGFGTGSFASEYSKRYGFTGALSTDNPHNQYTLYAVQFGVLGVVWFVLILISGIIQASRLPELEAAIMQGTVLMIGAGSLLNSWLSDTTETYLFVYFVALALGASLKIIRENDLENQS